ncbi:hypothetical protein AL035_15840 [Salipiger aestuarii]|uniref:Uncharacterized protein n=1 Tax=Salipiger aestuarii TaxID=568098 RepID=A0A327Y2P7_9RHOB|nr:hypothetical protein [Salipiger aestuarii]EIE50535.1 hypothetical protein C357_13335 [Citreicella sp. 357]KAB2540780.1 hypothetical protein AL035_15840 [Salipiger aestuarii]RAK15024.1 hypothetical protein ATI53_102646 [Salipiger aestuarii]
MTEIDELQGRMVRALDRIAQGVDLLGPLTAQVPDPEPDSVPETVPEPELETPQAQDTGPAPADDGTSAAEVARLSELLEEEKLANAQLEERNRTLNARLSEAPAAPVPDAALQEQLAAQRESMADLDAELSRLRLSNDMLRKTCEQLRAALQAGLGEPHLINQAMLAELESLRADRSVERAEVRAVLDAIEPVLSEVSGIPMPEEAVQ